LIDCVASEAEHGIRRPGPTRWLCPGTAATGGPPLRRTPASWLNVHFSADREIAIACSRTRAKVQNQIRFPIRSLRHHAIRLRGAISSPAWGSVDHFQFAFHGCGLIGVRGVFQHLVVLAQDRYPRLIRGRPAVEYDFLALAPLSAVLVGELGQEDVHRFFFAGDGTSRLRVVF